MSMLSFLTAPLRRLAARRNRVRNDIDPDDRHQPISDMDRMRASTDSASSNGGKVPGGLMR